jgi:hypothetical protein
MKDVNELLRGAIDMHLHIGPDEIPHHVDAIEAARQAKEAGMRAIVVKNHNYPTVPLAITAERMVPGIKVFGGLCFDYEMGGVNSYALEMSARLGAKVVWMPIASSSNSRDKMRRTFHLDVEGDGFSILDARGRLIPEMDKVLYLVKRYDMVLASGHISPEEIFALVKAAKRMGILKLLITHASNIEVLDRVLSVEEQKRLTQMGVFIEYVAVELLHESPGKGKPLMMEMIKAIGAEHCVISTDMGMAVVPPPVEGLRIAISSLLSEGFTREEMDLMIKVNPASLLGLS